MHRFLLPKISVLFFIYFFLQTVAVFAQAPPTGEIDVTKCWAYPTSDTGTTFSSEGTRVFVGEEGAKVEALSFDGKKTWSSELGGDITSNILAGENGLFLVTSTVSTDAEKPGGSLLRSLSKETGVTNWILKLPDAERHFLDRFNGSVIVVSKNGVVQSVDAKSGAVKWKREIADGFAAQPVFGINRMIVAATGRQIFAISLASGEIDSMRKVAYSVTSLGETPTGEIIAGDDRGNVTSLIGTTDKPYWRYKSGGEISKIFTAGESVFATSHDNFVYALASRNGDVEWKKRLTARVLQIGKTLDRFALTTGFEEHSAVFIDLSSGKVAGQVVFAEDESPVAPPFSVNGLIFVLTDKAAYAYSLNGCGPKKEGGLGKIIP